MTCALTHLHKLEFISKNGQYCITLKWPSLVFVRIQLNFNYQPNSSDMPPFSTDPWRLSQSPFQAFPRVRPNDIWRKGFSRTPRRRNSVPRPAHVKTHLISRNTDLPPIL